MALGLGFAEILGAVILLIAGVTGSSIGSVVRGEPDHADDGSDDPADDPSSLRTAPANGGQTGSGPTAAGSPLGNLFRLIGKPFEGTHGKAFNVSGGSDNWESENAVDLAVTKGTPVYAVADGTIGSSIGSLGSGGRFAGLRLHLLTAGNEWYYAHLSQLNVKAGQHVKAGDLLGYSGEANGVAHLHLAAKNGDPLKLLRNVL